MLTKLFPHPGLTALLLVVWMLMLNSFSAGGLVVGLVFATIVPVFTAPFWPDRPRLRFGWAMIDYMAIVMFDIIVANFHVARLILFVRNRDLRSRWMTIPLDLHSAEAITALAGTISLTPGTVSADVSADGRHLLVHALDTGDVAEEVARIKSRYEARLKRIFL
ncbi:MAG: Na+/H+ antiporter subunit E [Alphaproteobacteria bacterium]|nr:Na+/H+ antiporter subunit E [Alphaproteobacteria bacterium]MBU0793357.1 Na+/H+ antiporter subunit E [Alphaproteobacteria bacterium]MBU0876304.1 Na+/H+ antiporter subunit E [Alphaproteobacteria bacterium]MBU1768229.1 Na+/H+ antiporter subunit E [Alphaproteobacteria bacterium]